MNNGGPSGAVNHNYHNFPNNHRNNGNQQNNRGNYTNDYGRNNRSYNNSGGYNSYNNNNNGTDAEWEEWERNRLLDEYNGLMTPKQKSWLKHIQTMQLSSDNPYVDDYYFVVSIFLIC